MFKLSKIETPGLVLFWSKFPCGVKGVKFVGRFVLFNALFVNVMFSPALFSVVHKLIKSKKTQ